MSLRLGISLSGIVLMLLGVYLDGHGSSLKRMSGDPIVFVAGLLIIGIVMQIGAFIASRFGKNAGLLEKVIYAIGAIAIIGVAGYECDLW